MLDRSKCKKMLVKIFNGIYEPRIVIDIFNNGTCRYVTDEEKFLKGEFYWTKTAIECKPLPEKKTKIVPWSVEKTIKFLHDTPCFIRFNNNAAWMLAGGIYESSIPRLIKEGSYKLLDGTEGRFEDVEEVPE